jgi:hypothetical protein
MATMPPAPAQLLIDGLLFVQVIVNGKSVVLLQSAVAVTTTSVVPQVATAGTDNSPVTGFMTPTEVEKLTLNPGGPTVASKSKV